MLPIISSTLFSPRLLFQNVFGLDVPTPRFPRTILRIMKIRGLFASLYARLVVISIRRSTRVFSLQLRLYNVFSYLSRLLRINIFCITFRNSLPRFHVIRIFAVYLTDFKYNNCSVSAFDSISFFAFLKKKLLFFLCT